MLYAFGSNGSGQLGIGHRNDVAIPSACKSEAASSKFQRLKQVVAGGNDTFLFFSDEPIMWTGVSTQASISEFGSENDAFVDVSLPEPVKLCSATWDAFITVTLSNRIYTFGAGGKGELGRGSKLTAIANSPTLQPLDFARLIPPGVTIVDLASGLNHAVVVLSDGNVLGWGQGRKGQLGVPSEVVWEPRKIDGIGFPVVRAVCGREFTYLAGSPDQGYHAILGSDKWNLKTDAPAKVLNWKDIGASWSSIFVLDQEGCLVSWGRNDHGQLTSAGLPPVQKMAIGSEHAMVLTEAGKVLAWGWGEHGNCGKDVDEDGDIKHRWVEIPLPTSNGFRVFEIGAGCATSWILTQDQEEND